MVKVINPLFRKEEVTDAAYNCACICHSSDGHADASSWSWLPWNSCGATCRSGNTANFNANHDLSKRS